MPFTDMCPHIIRANPATKELLICALFVHSAAEPVPFGFITNVNIIPLSELTVGPGYTAGRWPHYSDLLALKTTIVLVRSDTSGHGREP